MWILFTVPCPTPDGQTARDLYEKRLTWISPEMQASAREHGCRFHQAWYAADGSAFWAIADQKQFELPMLRTKNARSFQQDGYALRTY